MRLTVQSIRHKKQSREKITVLTAYDFPTARILDESGIDIILVGDSVGMVLLGYENTLPVRMEDMLHHTKAVTRAVRHALVVSDMPFESYPDAVSAVRNARLLIEKGHAQAVKLEGGRAVEKQIKALVRAGIPVIGHLGMLPQSIKRLGGYRVQGRDPQQAGQIARDAGLLDKLGVFALVLECVPAVLAEKITRNVKCPTIGIGAGPKTDGQVLVLHDMLGIKTGVEPRFVRHYANLEEEIKKAVGHYRLDVLKGKFPSKRESY